MTERTQDHSDRVTPNSSGEIPLKVSLLTKHRERRTGIEVQNVTDFFQCLSIASTNSEMDAPEDHYGGQKRSGDEDDNELGLRNAAVAVSPTKDVKLKDPPSDRSNILNDYGGDSELEDALYRKKLELDIRAELLQANMNSESRKLDEANSKFNQLISQADSLSDDINGFIDEYQPRDLSNYLKDIDGVISKIERLRSDFRTVHKELRMSYGDRRYNNTFQEFYTQKLQDIKHFIHQLHEKRRSIRGVEDRAKDSR